MYNKFFGCWEQSRRCDKWSQHLGHIWFFLKSMLSVRNFQKVGDHNTTRIWRILGLIRSGVTGLVLCIHKCHKCVSYQHGYSLQIFPYGHSSHRIWTSSLLPIRSLLATWTSFSSKLCSSSQHSMRVNNVHQTTLRCVVSYIGSTPESLESKLRSWFVLLLWKIHRDRFRDSDGT